ncbi:MAG: response regulator [Gemmiger sp.]|nr:response regulator [Gemmiger sp.]
MYQVMIVDDEKMIINSLTLGFDWKSNGFEVVATATSSSAALKMIQFMRPDIVFTDIKMPGLSGIGLMSRVKQTLPQIKFVVISGYSDFSYAQQAIRLGALAYCLKPLENEDIADVLALAKQNLDATHAVIQSAFNKLLWQPSAETSESFLSALYSPEEMHHPLTVAVARGDARSLLSGNVGYTALEVSEGCNLYLISSNAVYLDSNAFQIALMNAAAEKRLDGFVYLPADDPAVFLAQRLGSLLDAAYAGFIDNANLPLGRADDALPTPSPALAEKFAAAANKNRPAEVLDLLSELTPQARARLTGADAVAIYNLSTELLCRVQNKAAEPKLVYSFELAARFADLAQMLSSLSKQMGTQNNGNINLDLVRNETLAQVLQYVHLNFAKPLSFQKICEAHSISPSYLSQLFKKELQINFMNYLYNLRLNYAKELLENTNMRVQEISEKVGFDYYYNFSKLFKREMGMTPKQYREEHQKEGEKAAASSKLPPCRGAGGKLLRRPFAPRCPHGPLFAQYLAQYRATSREKGCVYSLFFHICTL